MHVEDAFIGIADDGAVVVVSRTDDETFVADVLGIVAHFTSGAVSGMGKGQFQSLHRRGKIGSDKLLSDILGLALADRTSDCRPDA